MECFSDLGVEAFERVNASYVSEHFSERHGDMVWKVRLSDHVVYIYLLLEFQSHPERWMALRMQVYVGLLYQDLLKRHELQTNGSLPPVLPVVFHCGAAPWNASEELRHLVAACPEELSCYQASQRYLLIDQHRIDRRTLVEMKNLVAALFRIELSESSEALMDAAAMLGAWLADEDQTVLRNSIVGWIGRLQKREGLIPEAQRVLEGSAMGTRQLHQYGSMFEVVVDLGRQEGLIQGRAEAAVLAKRDVLKRLLERRFKQIPAAAALRIDGADEVEVERWIDRIFEADSVESLLSS